MGPPEGPNGSRTVERHWSTDGVEPVTSACTRGRERNTLGHPEGCPTTAGDNWKDGMAGEGCLGWTRNGGGDSESLDEPRGTPASPGVGGGGEPVSRLGVPGVDVLCPNLEESWWGPSGADGVLEPQVSDEVTAREDQPAVAAGRGEVPIRRGGLPLPPCEPRKLTPCKGGGEASRGGGTQ